MRSKYLLIIFILLACNSHKKEKTTNHANEITVNDSLDRNISNESGRKAGPRNFWDSIAMGLKLSYEQIKKYTAIDSYSALDSFYILNYDSVEFNFKENLGFWADSVYTTRHNFKVAILKHSGPNCLTRLMLVFDSTGTHNISYTVIEEGCDRDGEDLPYSWLEYRILTDSTFETIETSDPGDANTTHRYFTTEITKWKITNKGTIDSLSGKMRRKKPKY